MPKAILYVDSVLGSDRNHGLSIDSGLQTIARALTLAASLGFGTTIALRDSGPHRLTSPLVLSSAHSGVNFIAAPGESPVISGGVVIAGWASYGDAPTGGTTLWRAPTPAGVRSRSLYVNGVRCFRTLAANTLPNTVSLESYGYGNTGGILTTYANPTDIEALYRNPGQWTESRISPSSVGATTITMQPVAWGLRNKPNVVVTPGGLTFEGGWTHLENVYELLGTPGEFYHDYNAGYVYYVPRAGEDLTADTVTMPAIEMLLTISGATDVSFNGIMFADTTWHPTTEGFVEIQTGVRCTGPLLGGRVPFATGMGTLPAAVRVDGSDDVIFAGCTFSRLGAEGVAIVGGSQRTMIAQGCEFADISGNGVRVGDPTDWQTLTPVADVTISDAYLHDMPVEFRGSVPILTLNARRTTVENVTAARTPYSGIACGVAWHNPYTIPNVNQDDLVRDVYVRDVMQVMGDGANLYTNGARAGFKVLGGYLADSGNATNAVYLDNSAKPTVLENLVSASTAGIQANDGYGGHTMRRCFTRTKTVNLTLDNGSGPVPGAIAAPMLVANVATGADTTLIPATVLSRCGVRASYNAIVPAEDRTTPLWPDGVMPGNGGPSAVESLQAAVFGGEITLTWTPPMLGEVYAYEVAQVGGRADGADLTLASQAASSTGYVINGISANATYTFAVYARDSFARLSPAATVTISTGAITPTAAPQWQN